MRKINSGDLTERIQITQFNNVSDGAGGSYPQETVYWETWAKVTPYKSRNEQQANQDVLKDGFSFVIRYRSDKAIKPDMRIKWKGEYLSLTSAPTDYVFKEWLELKATWIERPEADPLPVASKIYFGTSATGDPLTEADVLAGTALEYISGDLVIPFNNTDPLLFNWFWLPDGIELPNVYENVDDPFDRGSIGTDQDLFDAFYPVGQGSATMSNYPVVLDGGFRMLRE